MAVPESWGQKDPNSKKFSNGKGFMTFFLENRVCSYLVVLKLDHAVLRPLGSRVVFRDIKRRLLIVGIHRFSVAKKKSEFSKSFLSTND